MFRTREQEMRDLEQEAAVYIARGSEYAVFRFDGRAFGSYTRDLDFPQDITFMEDMDSVAIALCDDFAGSIGAYVVSDEISLIIKADTLGDFSHGGSFMKNATVGAGLASAVMTSLRPGKFASFDGRGRSLSDAAALKEYLVHRQSSGSKNAISMAASSKFSHKALQGVNSGDRVAMLASVGYVYDEELLPGFRYGRAIYREYFVDDIVFTRRDTGELKMERAVRSRWISSPAPHFYHEEALAPFDAPRPMRF